MFKSAHDKMPLKIAILEVQYIPSCSLFKSLVSSVSMSILKISNEPLRNIHFSVNTPWTALRTKDSKRESERKKKNESERREMQKKSSPKIRCVMGSDLDTVPLKDDV